MSVVGPRYGAICRHPEVVKWQEALEPDDRDPRILGEGPCNQIHEPMAKYNQNQFGSGWFARPAPSASTTLPRRGRRRTRYRLGQLPR